MNPALRYQASLALLQQLISIPSFSRNEDGTAAAICSYLHDHGIPVNRHLNNVWAVNRHFDPRKPSVLLNSHHDTVKPNPQYTNDPFQPFIKDEKLFGLGSNDAGGCLVSLLASFVHFYNEENGRYNLVLAATAEEEISGYNGIEALLNDETFRKTTGNTFVEGIHPGSCAIVGEPTLMDLAIVEKGLMVLDGTASGIAGHAAREEGENAIYNAMEDISWFRNYSFEEISEWLGPVKMNVTVIETENKAHNMVPAVCRFVVDVRVTEKYTHEQVLEVIRTHVKSEVKPRSMRMRATGIASDHPLVLAGISLGKKCYGSPTSSDKALIPVPALKTGPGFSGRSHAADEFIYLNELREGISGYIQLLEIMLR